MRSNFESSDNITKCLKEICQGVDKKEILHSLSGKELSQLLLAFGKPALDGKVKRNGKLMSYFQ